jgi:hypothetical protein
MTAFNEAWRILKSRFADMKERFDQESGHQRGMRDAALKVTQTVPRFQLKNPPTPEELAQRSQKDDEDIMTNLVRQQMERNKEQGKISEDTVDPFAGL